MSHFSGERLAALIETIPDDPWTRLNALPRRPNHASGLDWTLDTPFERIDAGEIVMGRPLQVPW
ncbi:MAG TPA: hypothetical protein VHJ00_01795 [Bradyrhizobium sp.]|nr:hypothetical protein [Bradyrhizobium sp.]